MYVKHLRAKLIIKNSSDYEASRKITILKGEYEQEQVSRDLWSWLTLVIKWHAHRKSKRVWDIENEWVCASLSMLSKLPKTPVQPKAHRVITILRTSGCACNEFVWKVPTWPQGPIMISRTSGFPYGLWVPYLISGSEEESPGSHIAAVLQSCDITQITLRSDLYSLKYEVEL